MIKNGRRGDRGRLVKNNVGKYVRGAGKQRNVEIYNGNSLNARQKKKISVSSLVSRCCICSCVIKGAHSSSSSS